MLKYRSRAANWYKDKHVAMMDDRTFDDDKPHKSIQELYEQKKVRLAKFAEESFVKVKNDQEPSMIGVKGEAERISA